MPAPLIESFSLYLPQMPAALEGLRLLQVTDLHLRRRRARHRVLCEAAAAAEPDLLLLTGDFMHIPGTEPLVADLLAQLLDAARPTVGAFGVFGNHDTPHLRKRLTHLPVHWLNNAAWNHPRLPLTLLGVDCAEHERATPRGDLLGAVLSTPDRPKPTTPSPEPQPPFPILLAHMPTWLPVAAAMNIRLMFAGHTHGGQLRAPGSPSGIPFYNATPGWPLHLSTGILQARDTFAVVSRGLGESVFDGFRAFCRPHAPLITLHRSAADIPHAEVPICIQRW
ncbi:hypothetical protein HED60_08955 [Planctomycetales bacterium ZRK34]|nr:hypothetical protein HED60_08955 [Planctomycetales bacterium ZRK34]